MTKHIALSNGDLTVGIDTLGQVSEIYYPDISAGNHVGTGTMHHKVGVYCEGAVHWLDDGAWKVKQEYFNFNLSSRTVCTNRWLDLRLEFEDYIDSELNILVRNISVINLSNRQRHIKLFMAQGFVLNDNDSLSDTVQYQPAGAIKGLAVPAIAHYRGSTALLITGQRCAQPADGNKPSRSISPTLCADLANFDEFSVGHFGQYGRDYMSGVWCDAADGVLAGNPVEQGRTDSIIGFDMTLQPYDSAFANYYLVASDSIDSANLALRKFLHEGVRERTQKTAAYWTIWSERTVEQVKRQAGSAKANVDHLMSLVDTALSMCANISTAGAVITADGHDQLNVQPATAALTALAMSQYNQEIEASRIYDFFISALGDDNCLYPSYGADGRRGANYFRWIDPAIRPIRLADSALMVYALAVSLATASTSRSVPALWRKRWQKLGIPLADFLCSYIDPITKLPLASYHDDNAQPMTYSFDAMLTYKALLLASEVSERLKDTDRVIQYRAVADDIHDNIAMLWNEQRKYFYRGLTRQGDVITYDGTIDSYALLGARISNLFSDETMAVAEATLEREHICTNGTYVRHSGDNDRSDYALSQIMSLSLILNWHNATSLTPLLTACRHVLERGGYRSGAKGIIATNDVLLKAVYLLSSLKSRSRQEA